MRVFTYQIGDGDGRTIKALSHSETFGAADLEGAINKAKAITNKRTENSAETTVRLLEEIDSDSRVVWVSPVEAVR